MRKLLGFAISFSLAVGLARPAPAASILLTFEAIDATLSEYSVYAVGDVPWTIVNFAVQRTLPHDFVVNTANFKIASVFTSGRIFYYNDSGVIGACPGAGCFSAGETVEVGILLGSPFEGTTESGPVNLETGLGAILDPSIHPNGLGFNGADEFGSPIPVFVEHIVPEPGSVALLVVALAGLADLRRRLH